MSRAQSSVEGLTTYIFAFLAIVLVISLSWYFGLFDAETYAPTKCEFGENLACPSYTIMEDSATNTVYVDMELENYNDETIRVVAVKIKHKDSDTYCESYEIVSLGGGTVNQAIGSFGGDEDLRFAIQQGQSGCNLAAAGLDGIIGNKENFDIQIVYEKGESLLPFSSSGKIITTPVEVSSGVTPPSPPSLCVKVASCNSECPGDGWSDDSGITCYESGSCSSRCEPTIPPAETCDHEPVICDTPGTCSVSGGGYIDENGDCFENGPVSGVGGCTTPCVAPNDCVQSAACDHTYCAITPGEAWSKDGDCYSDGGCNNICPKCDKAPPGNCEGRCGDIGYVLDGVGCYTDSSCEDECNDCVPDDDCCRGTGGWSTDGGLTCFNDPDCKIANKCQTSCSLDSSCDAECSTTGYSFSGVCFDDDECIDGSQCTAPTNCVMNSTGCSGRCTPSEGFSDNGVGCYPDSNCGPTECPDCKFIGQCCGGDGGWTIDGGYHCFDGDSKCQVNPCDPACMYDSSEGTWYLLLGGEVGLGGPNCYTDSSCENQCESSTCYQDPICCGSLTWYNPLTGLCYTDPDCNSQQQSCPAPTCEADTCCGGGGYSMGGYGCYSDKDCLVDCNLCIGCQQQDLSFNKQINMFSIYVLPNPTNTMLDMVQPLIDEGKLVYVMDEDGKQTLPSGVDNIGPVNFLEGYIIKVNSISSLSVTGTVRTSPTTKNFGNGFNLFGMPKLVTAVDAEDMMTPLINQGCFVNMTDDSGNSLYYDSIYSNKWFNEIGNVVVDEGYIVYTNASCSLNMNPYI